MPTPPPPGATQPEPAAPDQRRPWLTRGVAGIGTARLLAEAGDVPENLPIIVLNISHTGAMAAALQGETMGTLVS